MTVNRDQVNLEIDRAITKLIQTLKAKSNDYATRNDPLRNLRQAEALGLPAEVGVVLRMSDKMSRLQTIVERLMRAGDTQIAVNESMADTALDLAGYSILLYTMIVLKEKQSDNTTDQTT